MKYLSVLFFLLMGLSFQASAQVEITDEKITVTISSENTRADLSEIRNELIEYEIKFRYNGINWEDGHMTSIKIQVMDAEGQIEEFENMSLQPGTEIKIVSERVGDKTLCVGTDCE